MTGTTVTCPSCGTEIEVSEALGAQVRAEIEANLRRESDERLRKAVEEAEARVRETQRTELDDLNAQLAEQSRRAEEARKQELEIRKRARELEQRQQDLDLELARRLDAEREKLEAELRKRLGQEQDLRLKEKEKQIEDLRKALDEARRKSQQGSQETQGEVLELDLEAALAEHFPHDAIGPVPKGARGADLLQRVRGLTGRDSGAILWETKNTKHFRCASIDKLKEDQRSAGAAVALREQLIQVGYARAASQGKGEKMELLYQYLSGDEFRHRIEAIVEAFGAMQTQLDKERRAMEKIWREREKQIERIIHNTAGMYGDVRGLIGGSLPDIPALELEPVDLLEDQRSE